MILGFGLVDLSVSETYPEKRKHPVIICHGLMANRYYFKTGKNGHLRKNIRITAVPKKRNAIEKQISDFLMCAWLSQFRQENTFEFVMKGFEFAKELSMYFLGKLVGRAAIMLDSFEKVFFDFEEVFRCTCG